MNVISFPVANAAALVAAGYTTIEIWRSPRLPAPLDFEEVTAASAQAATLTSAPANTLFNMGGFSLSISVNGGSPQTVTFGSVLKYWTPSQVAAQINTVIAGLASVVGESVVLTAPTTGPGSSLTIVTNYASDLGWVPGQTANGLDARLTLSGSTLVYQYTDLGGMNHDLYQWRFSANGANPISDFYPQPFPMEGLQPAVSTVNTTIAVAQFVDLEGRPKKARIIIAFDENPTQFGSSSSPLPSVAVGQGPQSKSYETDESGFLQVQLIQGLQIRVAIEGTSYVRQITVPSSVSTFDLLAAMAAAPDQFTIQTPLPYLIRQHI
jgi:hypothetical protein